MFVQFIPVIFIIFIPWLFMICRGLGGIDLFSVCNFSWETARVVFCWFLCFYFSCADAICSRSHCRCYASFDPPHLFYSFCTHHIRWAFTYPPPWRSAPWGTSNFTPSIRAIKQLDNKTTRSRTKKKNAHQSYHLLHQKLMRIMKIVLNSLCLKFLIMS